jgi:hypothetical protein
VWFDFETVAPINLLLPIYAVECAYVNVFEATYTRAGCESSLGPNK